MALIELRLKLAPLLTPSFSGMQRERSGGAVSTAFVREKLLKQFFVPWLRASHSSPVLMANSRFIIQMACSRIRSLSDSLGCEFMKTPNLLLSVALVQCVFSAFGIAFIATDSGITTFQESGNASSDNAQRLIGHWRKTTIVFESPKDEHLLLHADGSAENWVVRAESRSEPVTGRWSVEGKILTLSLVKMRTRTRSRSTRDNSFSQTFRIAVVFGTRSNSRFDVACLSRVVKAAVATGLRLV